jgi:hypothetical protein
MRPHKDNLEKHKRWEDGDTARKTDATNPCCYLRRRRVQNLGSLQILVFSHYFMPIFLASRLEHPT